jgi:hypothetical protein
MLRRLPPLNALRAFEAAARYESFTRAAEELCVTQGAVSHQVKALETELDLKLFHRERHGLVMTEAGRSYLEFVRDAFDRIAVGTERLLQRQSTSVLTVSISPNFAAKWLVHRLSGTATVMPTACTLPGYAPKNSYLSAAPSFSSVITRFASPRTSRGTHSCTSTTAATGPSGLRLQASRMSTWREVRSSIRQAWRSMPRRTARASRWPARRLPLGISTPVGWNVHSSCRCRSPMPIGSFVPRRWPSCPRSFYFAIGCLPKRPPTTCSDLQALEDTVHSGADLARLNAA